MARILTCGLDIDSVGHFLGVFEVGPQRYDTHDLSLGLIHSEALLQVEPLALTLFIVHLFPSLTHLPSNVL